MPRITNPTEEFLMGVGALNRRSSTQREVLGCIACKCGGPDSENSNGVWGYQIIRCTGLGASTVYPILQRLEDADVLTSAKETVNSMDPDKPPRRLHMLSTSALGIDVRTFLVPPKNCPLENLQ